MHPAHADTLVKTQSYWKPPLYTPAGAARQKIARRPFDIERILRDRSFIRRMTILNTAVERTHRVKICLRMEGLPNGMEIGCRQKTEGLNRVLSGERDEGTRRYIS